MVSNEKADMSSEAAAPDKDDSKNPEAAEVKPRREESKTPKANLRKFFKLVSKQSVLRVYSNVCAARTGGNSSQNLLKRRVHSVLQQSYACVPVAPSRRHFSPQPPFAPHPVAAAARAAFCISLSRLAREQPRGSAPAFCPREVDRKSVV